MAQAKLSIFAVVAIGTFLSAGQTRAQQRITPSEPVEMIYAPQEQERETPVSDWQLMFAAHLSILGPVGPFGLEASVDLANWISVRAIGGYVPDGNAHFGAAESFLDGFQGGGFVTARVPLGNWTIRPGVGLTVGAFDGEMLYDLDDHAWAEPEIGPLFSDENTDCVFGCNEDVKLDGVLWAHLEIGGQYRFNEDFFLRGYAGLSMGLYGWGLQECRNCTEQERDDKSGEIFGHTVDPYGGIAVGWAIDLSR